MRIFARRYAGLGQQPEISPAGQLALANRKPMPSLVYSAEAEQLWRSGALMVSDDGTQIVQPGASVSNSVYYIFLPNDGLHMAVRGLLGPLKDTIGYLQYKITMPPGSSIPDVQLPGWSLVDPAVQTQVAALLPMPGPLKTDINAGSVSASIESGFTLAESAKSAAMRGNITDAERFLMTTVGAIRELDKARVELKILHSFGFLSDEEYQKLLDEAVQPLAASVMEANQTIAKLKGAPIGLTILANIEWLAKAAALQLTYLAKDRWKKALDMYAALAKHNRSEEELIQRLEAGPSSPAAIDVIHKTKAALIQSKAAQAKVEGTLTSLGVNLNDLRKEAGLGQFLPTVVILGVTFTTTTVLSKIVAIIAVIIVQIIIFTISDLIVVKLFGIEGIEKEAFEEYKKGVEGQIKDLSKTVNDNMEFIRQAKELAGNNAALAAKVQGLETLIRNKQGRLNEKGIQVPVLPESEATTGAEGGSKVFLWLAVGGAAAALLYYFWKRK